MKQNSYDLLILGSGPAGWMAAVAANRFSPPHCRMAVLEYQHAPGKKLLVSGAGKCNVTNLLSAAEMAKRFSRNSNFVRHALFAFPPEETRRFFRDCGVPTVAEDGFHCFPRSMKALDILNALRDQALSDGKCELICNQPITKLTQFPDGSFEAHSATECWTARSVILATGGITYPELGGYGSGYGLAQQLNHTLCNPLCALAGLQSVKAWPGGLSGLVLPDAEAGFQKRLDRGNLLFTHRGVSGPAVLDLSGDVAAVLSENTSKKVVVTLHWDATMTRSDYQSALEDFRRNEGKKQLSNWLAHRLPQSLAAALLEDANLDGTTPGSRISSAMTERLLTLLTAYPLEVSAVEGRHRAMVTRGGIATVEIQPRTMESKLVKRLFFAGEVMDVDGPCGGYNIQWALSSGFVAGRQAVQSLNRGNEIKA